MTRALSSGPGGSGRVATGPPGAFLGAGDMDVRRGSKGSLAGWPGVFKAPQCRRAAAFAIASIVSVVAADARAANSTWAGTTADGLWTTAGNWSAGVPGTTTSVTTGANTDVVTFDIATNLAVNYGSSNRNIGGIRFGSAAGAFVVSRPGSNSTRLYFTLGDEVAVAAGVTTAQTLGRVGLAGTSGTYTFRNDSTTPAAKLDFATSFISASTGATTLVLTGTNPGGTLGASETSRLNNITEASGAGAMTLVKDGAGSWLLEGTNTYTGGTTINDGSLLLRGSATLGPGLITVNGGGFSSLVSTRTFASDRTWAFNGDFVHGTDKNDGSATEIQGTVSLGGSGPTVTLLENLTINGVVSGTAGLSITSPDTGRLTLAGVNAYTGPTTVLGGVLSIDGSTNPASTVTVNAGGTLAGTGTVGGVTAVSGIVSPARLNNLGTLSVAADLTWSGAVTADATTDWVFELGASNLSDRLAITSGDFLRNSSAGSNYRFDFAGAAEQGTFTLVEWSGSTGFVASDFSYTNLAPGFTGLFGLAGNSLTFTAVPEPSAVAVALTATGVALAYRRRSKIGRG
jgi:autotransporter-associated beta strand protein